MNTHNNMEFLLFTFERVSFQRALQDHDQTVVVDIAKLQKEGGYLSPDGMKTLREEIEGLDNLVKGLNIYKDGSDEEDEFNCNICFELPPANVFVCCRSELILCDNCKTQYFQQTTEKVTCPGCRANFVQNQNPRRSRIVEKEIRKLREKHNK